MSSESEYTMHSETLKLALKHDHEKEAARRVHVGFVSGKRVAVATDFVRLHAEPSESCVTTAGPMPAVGQVLVPESERRAVKPPEPAAVLHAEALGAKCRETALVAVGGQALNAHYVADALRHVGTVGACYANAALRHHPVTFESAEHPGRWACVMPCLCHADDVERYCADKVTALVRLAVLMDSAEAEDCDEEDEESLSEIMRTHGALRDKVAKLRERLAATALESTANLLRANAAERERNENACALANAVKGLDATHVEHQRMCDELLDARTQHEAAEAREAKLRAALLELVEAADGAETPTRVNWIPRAIERARATLAAMSAQEGDKHE